MSTHVTWAVWEDVTVCYHLVILMSKFRPKCCQQVAIYNVDMPVNQRQIQNLVYRCLSLHLDQLGIEKFCLPHRLVRQNSQLKNPKSFVAVQKTWQWSRWYDSSYRINVSFGKKVKSSEVKLIWKSHHVTVSFKNLWTDFDCRHNFVTG